MALSATSGMIAPFPKHQFLDGNGAPYASAKLFTYAAGTSTKQATYSDQALTTANSNPIVLDSAGRATIFLSATSYKFVLAPSTDTDPPASAIWTVDGVVAPASFEVAGQASGTAGETITAGQVCYLSDGTGSLTAGRWYVCDADNAYQSILPATIGVATIAMDAGDAGTFILGGRLSGTSGLSAAAGSNIYYLDGTTAGTEGSITSTKPETNARVFGVADSTTSIIMRPEDVLSGIERYEWSFITKTGNVGVGEDVLFTHNLGAGQIVSAYQTIKATFWGGTTNNANAKTLKFRLDDTATDTALLSASLTANEAGSWVGEINVTRVSATTARASAWVASGPADSAVTAHVVTVTEAFNCTWANAVEIRVTGTGTSDNDITANGGSVTIIGLQV